MGEPRSEEGVKRTNDDIKGESNTATSIADPSVFDENQNKLKQKNVMEWERARQNFVSNNAEEKSGNNITRFSLDGHESGNFCGMPGPSPSLLAALRSLGDNNDHMLLPHSLHQIAEAYFLEEDYPWAVQFLRLERLYHERLLSNLASLQEEWECQWKARTQGKSNSTMKAHAGDAESKCMDSLNHICRTHQRPNRTTEKDLVDQTLQSRLRGVTEETTCGSPGEEEEWTEEELESQAQAEEDDGEEEEVLEDEGLTLEGQEEVEDESELNRLEETLPANGLVSILKKRCCLEEADLADSSPIKCSYKRKVRFSETDDTFDNDEANGASCFMFLVLCLVTMMISMGGTALYCILGGAYSNICTDFSHNMEFYFGPVRRGVDALTCWLTSNS